MLSTFFFSFSFFFAPVATRERERERESLSKKKKKKPFLCFFSFLDEMAFEDAWEAIADMLRRLSTALAVRKKERKRGGKEKIRERG